MSWPWDSRLSVRESSRKTLRTWMKTIKLSHKLSISKVCHYTRRQCEKTGSGLRMRGMWAEHISLENADEELIFQLGFKLKRLYAALLTLGAHAREGYGSRRVCPSVCLFVLSVHLSVCSRSSCFSVRLNQQTTVLTGFS